MFRQCYEIHHFRFSLTSDCEELNPGLRLMYPAMAAGPGICATGWGIRPSANHGREDRSYRIYEDESLILETSDMTQLWDGLEWTIMTRILQNTRECIQLHASGIDAGGNALLLVGPSGSGKSSLALSLLRKGWKCLSDEVILLNPENNRVMPLPRSFRIDSRTLGLFPELADKLSGDAYTGGSGKARVDPALVREHWVAGSSAPAWLVFPRYRPGNSNDLIPIGDTDAMTALIGQSINLLDHGEGGLETLLRLVRNCRCFRFNTGDIHEASLAVSRLITHQAPRALRRNPGAGAEMQSAYQC